MASHCKQYALFTFFDGVLITLLVRRFTVLFPFLARQPARVVAVVRTTRQLYVSPLHRLPGDRMGKDRADGTRKSGTGRSSCCIVDVSEADLPVAGKNQPQSGQQINLLAETTSSTKSFLSPERRL